MRRYGAATWTAPAGRVDPSPWRRRLDEKTLAAVDTTTVLASADEVLTDVEAVVRNVDASALGEASGCGTWSIRDLLNHMTFENYAHAALAEGGHDMPTPDATTDYLGDDHVASYTDSVTRVRSALAAPGLLDRTFGPQEAPGSFVVQMLVNEMLTHGWDLARATGQPTDLAPNAAVKALPAAKAFYGDVPRGTSSFQPEQEAPAAATAADRLAAYLGRDPA